jgi:hypothetical protein
VRTTSRHAAGVIIVTMLAGVGAVGTHAFQASGPPLPRTDKGLYLLKVVEPGYDVTVAETERAATWSELEVRGVVPTVTAGGVVVFRAACDIAKERHFGFVFLAPSRESGAQDTTARDGAGRHLSLVRKLFLTNDPKTPLRDLLGTDYSADAQQMYDQTGYRSVAQLQTLVGGRGR